MSDIKVVVTEEDIKTIRSFLERRYRTTWKDAEPQICVEELVHWIDVYGEE